MSKAGKINEMDEGIHPESLRMLVGMVLLLTGLNQDELAAKAGLNPSSISRYLGGTMASRPQSLERILAVAALPMPLVRASILPALETVRAARLAGGVAEDLDKALAGLDHVLTAAGRATIAAFLARLDAADLEPWERSGPPTPADLLGAEVLWERLATATPPERRFLVETCPEFQRWGLAARLAQESESAAADRVKDALELARLAHLVAALAPGEEAWRRKLEGYALGFLANAERVAGHHKPAEATFARAWKLWDEGAEAAADQSLLPSWRLLDLEASLRRDQVLFPQALDLLNRAHAIAPSEAKGRILVKRASVLEAMGEAEQAIAVLREVAPLVDGEREPRLPCVLRFNLVANLCALERFAEAAPLLAEVRAAVLDRVLDLRRLAWLEGKVAAGLGQAAEAEAAFEEVRRGFQDEKLAYDCALVSLDLAALHLGADRTAAVRALATEMVWIFTAKGIHREAQAALTLFCRAARQEAATAELAQRVARYLERARHDPGLRFEGA